MIFLPRLWRPWTWRIASSAFKNHFSFDLEFCSSAKALIVKIRVSFWGFWKCLTSCGLGMVWGIQCGRQCCWADLAFPSQQNCLFGINFIVRNNLYFGPFVLLQNLSHWLCWYHHLIAIKSPRRSSFPAKSDICSRQTIQARLACIWSKILKGGGWHTLTNQKSWHTLTN